MELKKFTENKKILGAVLIAVFMVIVTIMVIFHSSSKKKDDTAEKEQKVTMRQELLDSAPPENLSNLMAVQIDEEFFNGLVYAETNLPNPAVEWFVECSFNEAKTLSTEQVTLLFDQVWLADAGNPWVYVQSVQDSTWVPILARDAGEICSGIRFGLRYFEPQPPDDVIRTEKDFNLLLGKIHVTSIELVGALGPVNIKPCCPPEEGAEKAVLIRDLFYTSNVRSDLLLQAPGESFFPGKTIWNTLRSLGLAWLEEDARFHLYAVEDGEHRLPLFSVWPECDSLSFPLEEIATDSLNPRTVHFSFTVPRTPQPSQVFENMLKAAQILQQKLGGELLSSEGKTLDAEKELASIEQYETYLSNAGYIPGSDQNLQIFPPLEIKPSPGTDS